MQLNGWGHVFALPGHGFIRILYIKEISEFNFFFIKQIGFVLNVAQFQFNTCTKHSSNT